MDFLLSLPKTLLDLAVSLLKIKKDDRSRQRLADLLASVARCISGIGDAIAEGSHPTKLCAELDTYLLNLEAFVVEETDTETAARLTLWDVMSTRFQGSPKLTSQEPSKLPRSHAGAKLIASSRRSPSIMWRG